MSSTVSVSTRSLALAAAVVVGLGSAYVLGSAARPGPTAEAAAPGAAAAPAAPRTITMGGTGDAVGVPDQLTFKLSVGSTAADVSTAMDQASRTVREVVAALREHGVEKKDVETRGLSIDPQYRYPDNQEPVITGYQVRQSVGVLVRSLRSGGKAISAAVSAGGDSSRISQLQLEIGDREDLIARARDAAVEEATAKARQYAEATGQDLGEVLTLREVSVTPRGVTDQQLESSLSRDMVAAKALPIQAGSETLDVEVSVVWELE